MATYRNVHTSFWQDGFVLGLTPEEKYFYLYLMTNSKTTQCGIYELPVRVIEMETGYNRETVEKLLDRFIKYKKILYNERTQEVMLTNWIRHNLPKSDKIVKCIQKEVKTVKDLDFIKLLYSLSERYGYPINTHSLPYGEEEEKEEEQEEEKEQEEKPRSVPLEVQDQITRWYNECKIKGGLPGLHDIFFYIPHFDLPVIERAMRKSEGKSSNYCCTVLNGWVSEGKTKMEHHQLIPFRQDKPTGKTAAQIAIDREIAFNKWVDAGGNPDEFHFDVS